MSGSSRDTRDVLNKLGEKIVKSIIDFHNISTPDLNKTPDVYKLVPPGYKDTHLKQQAEDIMRSIENQFAETNKILERQFQQAMNDAESAKRDARFSKIVSVISLVIAIISAAAAIIALF